MSCTPLPKAAKPFWAKQLTRLPFLVLCVKFQLVYVMNYVNIFGMNSAYGVMTFHLWRKFDYAVQSDSGTKTCFDAQDQVEYSKGFQVISDN